MWVESALPQAKAECAGPGVSGYLQGKPDGRQAPLAGPVPHTESLPRLPRNVSAIQHLATEVHLPDGCVRTGQVPEFVSGLCGVWRVSPISWSVQDNDIYRAPTAHRALCLELLRSEEVSILTTAPFYRWGNRGPPRCISVPRNAEGLRGKPKPGFASPVPAPPTPLCPLWQPGHGQLVSPDHATHRPRAPSSLCSRLSGA